MLDNPTTQLKSDDLWIGKFNLMGKEATWTYRNNRSLYEPFDIA
jgi:hypothetical protein